jgi:RNA polymerase sigma factor (sigma-70 family)
MDQRDGPNKFRIVRGALGDVTIEDLLGSQPLIDLSPVKRKARARALNWIVTYVCPRVEATLKLTCDEALHDDIDDALESALCMLWERGCAGYSSAKGTFKSWFYRVVKNRLVDAIRRTDKERQENLVLFHHQKGRSRGGPTDDESDEASPIVQVLIKALEELRGRNREIIDCFWSTDGEGEWAKRLADDLGLSPEVIRVAWYRLKKRLKARIEAELESGGDAGPRQSRDGG